jgi:hypothetical protein
VSTQVSVTQGATIAPFLYGNYTKQLHLTNRGAAVAGPVYVVLDGICNGVGTCAPLQTAAYTTCQVPIPYKNTPMVLVAPSGLAPSQTLTYTLQFQFSPPVPFTTRVFSGTPSQ